MSKTDALGLAALALCMWMLYHMFAPAPARTPVSELIGYHMEAQYVRPHSHPARPDVLD